MTAEHTPELATSLSAYALGALDGEDLRLLEEHLAAGCGECRTALADCQGSLETLAAGVPPVAPSSQTRARLLAALGDAGSAAVRSESPAPLPFDREAREIRRPRAAGRPGWRWLAAAAALILLVWGGYGQWVSRGEIARLGADRDRLERQVSGLGSQLAAAQAETRRMERAMQIIAAPGMRPVVLAGLPAAPKAAGHTFVDPVAGRAVFFAANLPALAPDRVYELWFIAGGKPVPAGTFAVDARGDGRLDVEGVAPVATIQAWAVTVEPVGGVPQPTGAMVLKG